MGNGAGRVCQLHHGATPRHGAEAWTPAGAVMRSFLVTLVDSSISVSLLLLLRRGSSSRAEIDHLSSSRAMVASRLEKLCANGLLRRAGAATC